MELNFNPGGSAGNALPAETGSWTELFTDVTVEGRKTLIPASRRVETQCYRCYDHGGVAFISPFPRMHVLTGTVFKALVSCKRSSADAILHRQSDQTAMRVENVILITPWKLCFHRCPSVCLSISSGVSGGPRKSIGFCSRSVNACPVNDVFSL